MTLNLYLSIITLNVNGLNVQTKRHRVSEWIKKQDPSICCLQETHFRPEDTFRLEVRGWRTIYHATGSQKKAGVATLISDKLDFNNYKCLCAKYGSPQIYRTITHKHKQPY